MSDDVRQTPGLYPARPEIKIDGERQPRLEASLLGFLAEENTEGLYHCEVTLGNWGTLPGGEVGFLYFDRQLIDFGSRLEITAGAGETAGAIFSGRVTGLEGRYFHERTPELAVLAEDRLQDLRMVRRTRVFENVSDGDVIRTIASEHSLQADVALDGASVTHKVLAQVNQSNLAFLRERARAIGAELWVEGDRLFAKSRGRRGTPEVSLTWGQRLLEFTVLADLAGQRTSVTASGWDTGAKQAISVEAAESAVANELGGGQGGTALLNRALGGERKELLVHTVPASDAEARAVAEAAYRRAARRFLTGMGVTEGDTRIKVGCQINLGGLGPLFDGKYYVAEVRHQFDLATGYRTVFRVERPWIGG